MSERNIQRVRTWKGRKEGGKKERQGGGRLLVARAVRRSRRGEYSSEGEIYKKKKKAKQDSKYRAGFEFASDNLLGICAKRLNIPELRSTSGKGGRRGGGRKSVPVAPPWSRSCRESGKNRLSSSAGISQLLHNNTEPRRWGFA